MPTVSVIIPAYNCEQYIAQTVDSVLAQTQADVELIVVNDGSTDRTREILAGYGARLRIVEQPNAGVCAARNRGLREARGGFVCLMDHDDYWFADKLQRQVDALQRAPEIGVVYADFILWARRGADGAFPEPAEFDPGAVADEIDAEFSGWIYHQFLLDCWMLTSTAMFRAEVFRECGVFDESLPYSEDWELWFRVSRRYRFQKFRRPNTLYRQHAQQGNRKVRAVDYRTELLRHAARTWGLCSQDGRCVSRATFQRQLARYHADFGLMQLVADNRRKGIDSLARACLSWPGNPKYPAYVAAALLGWKPTW